MESTSAAAAAAGSISEAASKKFPIEVPEGTKETVLFTRNRKFLNHNLAAAGSWRFVGGLYAPPLDSDFILPPQIDVQVYLKRADKKLTIQAANGVGADDVFYPKIINMRLMVKYVVVTPETYQAKLTEMSSVGLSIPLPRYHLTNWTIEPQQTHSIPIFRNQKQQARSLWRS